MVVNPICCASSRPLASNLDDYYKKVQSCNSGKQALKSYTRFSVDGLILGYINPKIEEELLHFSDVFEVCQSSNEEQVLLAMSSRFNTPDERTHAMSCITNTLKKKEIIGGWRDELIVVRASFHADPKFLMERAALAYFGIRGYGIHVNGYTIDKQGNMEMWVARRALSKQTFPGKLDHITAGAVPYGINCQTNVQKECREEANIPVHLAQYAKPVGAVTCVELLPCDTGVRRDVLFVYDLQLPPDFQPNPIDGEVEEFMRLPIEQVAEMVAYSDEFKSNCNIVLIHFLIRHGYLTPDQEGYLELLDTLKDHDCS
eukprot:TRINITY_DN12655_c0_g1_i2.p1 TRINITY_DN12655_c0_g1~~TRINITY_DN12655_c0_g1_i2.p1  ORF type:complete len:315 (-),score=46.68 TRINITY_DN12655_c0_g1_i2:283-1227(-)